MASVLSLVIPGVGQFYNGDFWRGLFWLIITPGLWIGSGGLLGWICHVIAAITAYTRAGRFNRLAGPLVLLALVSPRRRQPDAVPGELARSAAGRLEHAGPRGVEGAARSTSRARRRSKRCQLPPLGSTPAERALAAAGWIPFHNLDQQLVRDDVEIVGAMTGADGMCRPAGYNLFVFVRRAVCRHAVADADGLARRRILGRRPAHRRQHDHDGLLALSGHRRALLSLVARQHSLPHRSLGQQPVVVRPSSASGREAGVRPACRHAGARPWITFRYTN